MAYPDLGFHLFVPKAGEDPLMARVISSKYGRKMVYFHNLDGTLIHGKVVVPVLVKVALNHGQFLPLGADTGPMWVSLTGLKSRLARNGNGH